MNEYIYNTYSTMYYDLQMQMDHNQHTFMPNYFFMPLTNLLQIREKLDERHRGDSHYVWGGSPPYT